jgi:hypothetical protein
VGSIDTPGTAIQVAVSGTYLYVADDNAGLQVIDVTDPENPEIVGVVDTPGAAYDVVISGNHAYVADHGAGLQVIDITIPASPQIVGSVDSPGLADGVAVSLTYAYLADGRSGIQVIDVTDPANPLILGGVDTPGYAQGVAVGGSHLYAACEEAGLVILPLHCEPGDEPIGPFTLVSPGLGDSVYTTEPQLVWNAAIPAEGGPVSYTVYWSEDPFFLEADSAFAAADTLLAMAP